MKVKRRVYWVYASICSHIHQEVLLGKGGLFDSFPPQVDAFAKQFWQFSFLVVRHSSSVEKHVLIACVEKRVKLRIGTKCEVNGNSLARFTQKSSH